MGNQRRGRGSKENGEDQIQDSYCKISVHIRYGNTFRKGSSIITKIWLDTTYERVAGSIQGYILIDFYFIWEEFRVKLSLRVNIASHQKLTPKKIKVY